MLKKKKKKKKKKSKSKKSTLTVESPPLSDQEGEQVLRTGLDPKNIKYLSGISSELQTQTNALR